MEKIEKVRKFSVFALFLIFVEETVGTFLNQIAGGAAQM